MTAATLKMRAIVQTEYGTADVLELAEIDRPAIEPDEVVLGGGNVHRLKELPPKCRAGDNARAFQGGFRLWEKARPDNKPASPVAPVLKRTDAKMARPRGRKPEVAAQS